MPRSSSGVYSLPVAPFVPNTVIESAEVNSDFSDIATALTQSLATTGVSSMTGPFKLAAGSALVPSLTFASALKTGFFLSNTNEFTWVANSVIGAIFGATLSVQWAGTHYFGADVNVTGSLTTTGNANLSGNMVVATASVNITNKTSFAKIADPTSAAANNALIYVKSDGPNNYAAPYIENENGEISPLLFTGGQCQLTKSGTSLVLLPFGGNRLTVDGVPCILPNGGVSLAASNSAATFVYIYAVATAGIITSIEMSTTVPIAQATSGVKQKTGDATRTLVGAAYTDTGGAWADTDGKLWVLSYFNRRRKNSVTYIQSSLTTTAAVTYLEVNASMRNNFISWSDEEILLDSFLVVNTAAANSLMAANNVDGTTNTGSNSMGATTGLSDVGISNHSKVSALVESTTHYGTIFVRGVLATTYACQIPSIFSGSIPEGTKMYVQING